MDYEFLVKAVFKRRRCHKKANAKTIILQKLDLQPFPDRINMINL